MSERWAWYVARLRAMEPSEVAARSWRAVEAHVDDAAARRAPALWRRRWEPPRQRLLESSPLLERPLGILDAERAALVREAVPDDVASIVERAELAVAGRVTYLGYPEVQLELPIDYARDPLSGRRWPDRHGKLLDYRTATAGDPKWIWELNRLQELPLLALAWQLTGDERYAGTAASRMSAWIASSTPGRGIGWSNGFEPALRTISLALCFDALRGSPFLSDAGAETVLRALWQSSTFTLHDLSPPSSANNHLLGELAGLALVGLLAPELRRSDDFTRRGLEGLAREATRQILPDGMGAEQAFGYQLFVLDLILLVVAVAELRHVRPPSELRAALARAGDALASVVGDDEPDPASGDSDDGRAFVLDGAAARTSRGVAASIAAADGHAGARRVAGALDPAAVLLFGAAGCERFERTTPAEAPGDAFLPDAGLVVLRRSGVRTTVDVGPHGYLTLAAHGHADALHVTLSRGATELVVDPGTGSYFGDPATRAAFRGTPSHSTVSVDDLDQADPAGPFLWGRHPRTALGRCDLEAGLVVATHDGYARLADPVLHRRTVLALADGSLLVVDRLDARGSHRYAQTWPLDPRLDAALDDGRVTATLAGEPQLLLTCAATPAGAVRLDRSQTSRRLERTEPSWTARHVVEAHGPATLVALLGVASWHDPVLVVRSEGSTTRISFELDGSPVEIELDASGARGGG